LACWLKAQALLRKPFWLKPFLLNHYWPQACVADGYIDLRVAATVQDARCQIAKKLKLQPACNKLVTAACAEPDLWDPIRVLRDGPVAVVILY